MKNIKAGTLKLGDVVYLKGTRQPITEYPFKVVELSKENPFIVRIKEIGKDDYVSNWIDISVLVK